MSLRTGLSLAFAYVLLLAILALGLPLALGVDDRVGTEVRSQARSQADVVAATASDLLGDRRALDRLARTAGESVRGRVTVVDARGRVLADGTDPAAVGTSYRARPEFRSALAGRAVQDTRDSRTLDQTILATAVPVLRAGRPAGAVRVTQSAEAIGRAERRSLLGLAALAAVVLLIGLGVGALLARGISRPLRRLDATARLIADGDLEQRARVEGSREQRSLARAFNTMTARLAESLDAQRRFVADASHQLRTPLTGLKLRMEEARQETDEPAVHEEIDAGLAEVDRLTAIVEELLLLSSAGERSANPEWIDLAEAARDARLRWRGLADERGIALDVRAGPTAGSVTCSRAALDGAVDVLVENALRYSEPGTVVEILAGPDRVEVLDRGPGLEEGEQELVLQRFHRGSAGRRGPKGSGLGLPIATELAREWGARVELVNREGGGARAVLSWDERGDEA
ncbi:MAG TPA: ATP-binding protein [Thermoleophilaceae bacterium]|nr:ATP-binding protein [Thermoleophilaceae bacterium]